MSEGETRISDDAVILLALDLAAQHWEAEALTCCRAPTGCGAANAADHQRQSREMAERARALFAKVIAANR